MAIKIIRNARGPRCSLKRTVGGLDLLNPKNPGWTRTNGRGEFEPVWIAGVFRVLKIGTHFWGKVFFFGLCWVDDGWWIMAQLGYANCDELKLTAWIIIFFLLHDEQRLATRWVLSTKAEYCSLPRSWIAFVINFLTEKVPMIFNGESTNI